MAEFIYSGFRTQVRLCSSFYDQALHRRLGSHLFQAWLASPCVQPRCSSIYFPFQESIPRPCLPFVPKWPSVSYCGAAKTHESCRSWSAPQSPPCLAQHVALSWRGSVHRTVSLSPLGVMSKHGQPLTPLVCFSPWTQPLSVCTELSQAAHRMADDFSIF